MEKNPTLTKITRPKLSGIFPRWRLFELIDQARKKPIAWISAPAGSGKTTLVASYLDSRGLPCVWYQVDAGDGDIASFFYYMGAAMKRAAPRYKKPLPLLTPEYLQSIPVFTRRYFEELFGRLRTPHVIVLDNYQDAPQESGFNEMIGPALETVPEGVRIVIISRNDPPPQLARFVANNRMQLIGWDDVRFNREESAELLKTQGRKKPDTETIALLHERTEGWAAGLVLLMAGAGAADPDARVFHDKTPDAVFDYFATEIFGNTSDDARNVLLRTSFLQRIDPVHAERISGNSKALHILERLSRNHYFTQKYDRSYQYHPLFREFLQARAKETLAPDDVCSLQRNAAALLEESGRQEEAVQLLLAASEWTGAERMLLSVAPVWAGQGRSKTLEGMLTRLPADRVDNSPWALYWLGMCRMGYDPLGARVRLGKAFSLFRAGEDRAGLYLSWAGIIDTFVFAWSDFRPLTRWRIEFEELSRRHPMPSSPEIEARVTSGMFALLFWSNPQHPDLAHWAERLLRIVLGSDSPSLRLALGNNLIMYYLWMDDFSKATIVVEALRAASRDPGNGPLELLWWHAIDAMHAWFTADHEGCLAAITSGVALGRESGVHLLDFFLFGQGVYSGLTQGDPDTADEMLARIKKLNTFRTVDKSLLHFMAASVDWYHGRLGQAVEHDRLAVGYSEEAACPFTEALCRTELAVVLFDSGSIREAEEELDRAFKMSVGLTQMEFVCGLFRAWFALEQGDQERGIDELRRSLAIAAKQNYVNFSRWRARMMSRICAVALEHDIEPEYVRKLVSVRKLAPPENTTDLTFWPWPVMISALGGFEVRKDGQQAVFAGKKKQMELLKVLIALGGNSIREEQVTDVLWPDAEGDDGHNSFKMTLSRLRGMIGSDAILCEDGVYSLNRKTVRVDAWDFERLGRTAIDLWDPGKESKDRIAEAMSATEKALLLYRGSFLPDDDGALWSVSRRERLRSDLMRLLVAAARHYEDKGKWKTAAAYYEKGLEADPLQEEFYLRLMICHQKLGQHADVIAVYRRCCSELSILGITPSRQTSEIYESLK